MQPSLWQVALLVSALVLSACGKQTAETIGKLPVSSDPITGIAFVVEEGFNRDIHLIQPDGSGRRVLIATGKADADPAFSPNGQTLAFRSRRDGSSEIYLVAADGAGEWLNLVNDPAESPDDEFNPTWHPSGNLLVVYTDRFQPPMGNCRLQAGVHHLAFLNLDLAQLEIRHFDHLAGEQQSFSWSPDGRTLAFSSICTERHVRIFLYDMITNAVDPLTDGSYAAANPAFSPDGGFLAFTSSRDGSSDIMVYDLKAGTVRNLTRSTSNDRHPTWSPDGQWIAFTSDEAGNDDIFIIRLDGTGRVNITGHPSRELLPDWSPVP